MILREVLTEYISWKRELGSLFESGAGRLRSFEKHIGHVDLKDISKLQIRTFLDGPQISSVTWRDRYFLLYRFFEYCYARRYIALIPMPENRPASVGSFVPHIYSRDEVRRLLKAVFITQEGHNIAAETLSALILFLYCTGAKVSEALRLRRRDFDFQNMRVCLFSTQVDGLRTIPISKDLNRILHVYFQQTPRRNSISPFFSNKKGLAISRNTLKWRFQILRDEAMVTKLGGARVQPTLHCLRHTFAVHRVIEWLTEGQDLNLMMPALSVYIGQVGLSSTERYLKLAPERFRKQLAQISDDRKRPNWRKNRKLMQFLDRL